MSRRIIVDPLRHHQAQNLEDVVDTIGRHLKGIFLIGLISITHTFIVNIAQNPLKICSTLGAKVNLVRSCV